MKYTEFQTCLENSVNLFNILLYKHEKKIVRRKCLRIGTGMDHRIYQEIRKDSTVGEENKMAWKSKDTIEKKNQNNTKLYRYIKRYKYEK